ncbi:MAG: hypothetical protein WA775_11410 [Psychroserpens sp.]|uniref:hypothetical protein n=1 Tax=Psychroserpens sp. TaxID=2020870 RepID=UPI003C720C84
MVSKLYAASFAILLLFSMGSLQAQSDEEIVLNQLVFNSIIEGNSPSFYFGNINLKNNQVLKGDISLNKRQNNEYAAILRNEDGLEYILNSEIESITLIENTYDTGLSTRFVPLKNQEKLFRQLYLKDSENAIYDLLEKPFDGRVMNDVYVLNNNELISIYNFWHSGPKADLLHYFEDRDKKAYKRRDFKTLDTLFAQL